MQSRIFKTHCHGYDKFKDYLLGNNDGIKKDPEWAQTITGLDKTVSQNYRYNSK